MFNRILIILFFLLSFFVFPLFSQDTGSTKENRKTESSEVNTAKSDSFEDIEKQANDKKNQKTSSNYYVRFLKSELEKMQLGYYLVLSNSFYSGDQEVSSSPNLTWLGLELQYRIWSFPRMLIKKDLQLSFFFPFMYGEKTFSMKSSNVGKHNLTSHDFQIIPGLKLALQSFKPINFGRFSKMKLSPFFKLGLSTSINTYGGIDYPSGPRTFEIASLQNQYGLYMSLGLDVLFRSFVLSPEIAYTHNFNTYQEKRKFTFIALKEEFKNPDSVNDVNLSAINFDALSFALSFRYSFNVRVSNQEKIEKRDKYRDSILQ